MKRNTRNLEIKLCYPVETIFLDVVNSITDVKTDEVKYPDAIFYFNNDKYIAYYNSKNKYFQCNFYYLWSKFYFNNAFNYMNIKYLLKNMIEKHFKLKGITTEGNDMNWFLGVEEHFELKGITTISEKLTEDKELKEF